MRIAVVGITITRWMSLGWRRLKAKCVPASLSHVLSIPRVFLPEKLPNMSNVISEKPDSAQEIEEHAASKGGTAYDVEKKGYDRTGAIDAEKLEHDMTVLQAVKAYPAASWWAFVMSCTIVSFQS